MNVIDRVARAITQRFLRRISTGQLVVHEGGEQRTYGSGPPVATVHVRSPKVWRKLLRGSRGLAESYFEGLWDSPDVTAVVRLAARNVEGIDRLRRRSRRCARRSSARRAVFSPQQTRRARAAVDRRPLRPRQRPVRADARPDDDVLVRALRAAGDDARGGVGREARARLRAARPRPRRPRARDRHRLGRLRGARGRHARLPRHDHDDLARAARLGRRERAPRRARAPRHRAARGLPRPHRHLRQARVARDDRGGRLAPLRHVLRAVLRTCSRPTG